MGREPDNFITEMNIILWNPAESCSTIPRAVQPGKAMTADGNETASIRKVGRLFSVSG
jgi:hypothetical protein